MPLELIQYLTRMNGRNLEKIMPGLTKVPENQRFDSHKFDILTCNAADKRFYGISQLMDERGIAGLERLMEDARWMQQFGSTILLIAAEEKDYGRFFDESEASGLIIKRYYHIEGSDYRFSNVPPAPASKGMDMAYSMLTHPQTINYVLRKIEKKSEIIRLARLAYNVYNKVR